MLQDLRWRATYLRKDACDAAEGREKKLKLFNSCHAQMASSAGQTDRQTDSRALRHSQIKCKNSPDPLDLSGSRCAVGVIPAEPSAHRRLVMSPTAGRGTRFVRQTCQPKRA